MSRSLQEQEVTIRERAYKIKKFTPQVGCYWATRLFGDMISALSNTSVSLRERLPELIKAFTQMNRKDYESFQKDCLSFVSASFDGKYFPLLNDEGFFVVPDIPAPVVMELTMRSFMFTIVDFLDQSLLESLLGAVPDDIIAKETTSSNSSTLPSD